MHHYFFNETRTAENIIIIRLEFNQFWLNASFLYPFKVPENENVLHVFMRKEIHHCFKLC